MTIVSLSDLVAPASSNDVLALELSIAQALNLPTTAWQPLSMARTLLATRAQIISRYASVVNLIAQGGYASYAALMVDVNGTPITTWMDLILSDNFNVQRIPITFAAGPVTVSNSTASPYAYSIGQLRFQNPTTGATYFNTLNGTIAAGPSVFTDIIVQADQAFGGTAGTSGAGVTLTMLTPLPGVTVVPLSDSLVGQNAESNGAALTRAQSKLGTLSALGQLAGTTPPVAPGGSQQSYDFVIRSIPTASVASSTWPFRVVTPITRVTMVNSLGAVFPFVANAAGPLPIGDLNAAQAAVAFLCAPQAIAVQVQNAANAPVDVSYTVYVRASGMVPDLTITTNIADALAQYFATVPIGGITTSSPNIIPIAEIENVIFDANPGITLDLTMNGPTTDVFVGVGNVPTLGPGGVAKVVQV